MKKRRSHSKITQELPEELLDAVNKLISQGMTYKKIEEFLLEKGHQISYRSVGRYAQGFLQEMEQLNVFREQVKAALEHKDDAPALEMTEAASAFAIQKLFNYVLDPNLSVKEKTEVMKTIAMLERSGVSREKLKMEFKKGLKLALDAFKKDVYAEIENKEPDLVERLIQVANRVADRLEGDE